MSLRYGGKPILLEQDGQVADFLKKSLPLDGLRAFAPPVSVDNGFTGSIDSEAGRPANLPLPNYPAPPAIGVNQLYWPQGASRWAFGHFLMAKSDAEALSLRTTPYILKVGGADGVINISLYLLQSRPLSAGTGERLELVTLVDERYFWHFRATADADPPATWDAAFTAIKGDLGISFTNPTISADYLIPDATELSRRASNAAVMFDAIAHSVGCRVVRHLDATVEVITASDSTTRLNDQKNKWTKMAGAVFGDTLLPENVSVSFAKWPKNCAGEAGGVYIDTAAAPGEAETVAGTEKIVHSTAKADVSDDFDADPDNKTELDTLAAKIGSDYYDWAATHFDISLQGIVHWLPTGFDDHILLSFRKEFDCGVKATADLDDEGLPVVGMAKIYDYTRSTRVQSLPPNFGVEYQLSQDSGVDTTEEDYGEIVLGKMDANLSDGGSATMSIWSGDAGSETDSTDNVTVNDWLLPSGEQVSSGKKVVARKIGCEYYVIAAECED